MTVMAEEIRQSPQLVREQLGASGPALGAVADAVRRTRPRWVSVVARGTSDHAAVFARYLIETQLGWPVALASPSVTTVYRAPTDWTGGLVLAVSQSGRSPDLVAVVEAARRGGALTVAVTNVTGSPLELAAAYTVPCRAGEERAVAATKSYVAELAALAGIVAALLPDSDLAAALPHGLLERVERVTAVGSSSSRRWLSPVARSSSRAASTWPRPSRPPSSSRRPAESSPRATRVPTLSMGRSPSPAPASRPSSSARMGRWARRSTPQQTGPGRSALERGPLAAWKWPAPLTPWQSRPWRSCRNASRRSP